MKKLVKIGYTFGAISWALLAALMAFFAQGDEFTKQFYLILFGICVFFTLVRTIKLCKVNKMFELSSKKIKTKLFFNALPCLLGLPFVFIAMFQDSEDDSYGSTGSHGRSFRKKVYSSRAYIIKALIYLAIFGFSLQAFIDYSQSAIIGIALGASGFFILAGECRTKFFKVVFSIFGVLASLAPACWGFIEGFMLSAEESMDTSNKALYFAAVLFVAVQLICLKYGMLRKSFFFEIILLAAVIGISFLLELTGIIDVIYFIFRIVAILISIVVFLDIISLKIGIVSSIFDSSFSYSSDMESISHHSNESYSDGGVSNHYYLRRVSGSNNVYIMIDKAYAHDLSVENAARAEAESAGFDRFHHIIKYYN